MTKIFRNIRRKLASENKVMAYSRYAFGEIVLVVVGILIALQVNNWNETRLEQNSIRQYAKSLIDDLKSDIEMLNVSQFQAAKKFEMIDSLRYYITHTPYSKLSNTDLFVMCHDIMYRPYKWNRSTLNELKSSGGLRYVTNNILQNKIVAYESYSNHLDEDFEFDKSNAGKADDLIAQVLNLNSPYIIKINEIENNSFSDPSLNLFKTEAYKLSIANDLKLLSYDKTLILRFINNFILIQDQYRIRAFKEMPEIIGDARELITFLQKEYQL